jgi:hypothetical protein
MRSINSNRLSFKRSHHIVSSIAVHLNPSWQPVPNLINKSKSSRRHCVHAWYFSVNGGWIIMLGVRFSPIASSESRISEGDLSALKLSVAVGFLTSGSSSTEEICTKLHKWMNKASELIIAFHLLISPFILNCDVVSFCFVKFIRNYGRGLELTTLPLEHMPISLKWQI